MEHSCRGGMLNDIISKLIIYSSEKHSNSTKLLKYLTLVRQQRSSNKFGFIETNLRKAGAIRGLILYFNRYAANCDMENNSSEQVLKARLALVSNGLSILGNAFAIDNESREEGEKYKFIISLKNFLESKEFPFYTPDVLGRLIKCLANLAVSEKTRSTILREGIGILIINKLDEIYKKLTRNLTTVNKSSIEEVIIEKNEEIIVIEAVRAVRIFCSEGKFQEHLVRFGAILIVGKFLRFSYNQTLFSEILRALSILASSVKGLSREALEDLTDSDGSDKDILIKLIDLLKTRHAVSKVADPTLICLTHLATNTIMAKALINFEVFEAALEATKHSDNTCRLEKLLRLFVLLTNDSSASNGYLSSRLRLACCSQLGETLKILTNSHFKDYHNWILSLYENLYEEKLKDLVSRGIIRILEKYVRQEWGEFSMDILQRKVSSLDDDVCRQHSRSDVKCPFYPKYSCSSPSYKQFQQESEQGSISNSRGFDTISTFMGSKAFSSTETNPPHSRSVVYPFSPTGPTYSPVANREYPAYAFSPASPNSSDDEGIYSSSSKSPNGCQHFSSTNDVSHTNCFDGPEDYSEEESEMFLGESCPSMDCTVSEPQQKKLKTNSDVKNGHRKKLVTNVVATTKNNSVCIDLKPEASSSKDTRLRTTKISAILGILSRCSHFSVLPSELTIFLPFLLEMIWSGRISVEKRHHITLDKTAKDMTQLRRGCFERAFRIVFRICSDISVFPKLIHDNIIPCMYRIFVYDLKVRDNQDENQTKVREFISNYSVKIMDALIGILDSKNETGGWRQGYFQSICCTKEIDKNYINVILSIPLLYRRPCPIYRELEEKTKHWEKIFQVLTNIDELPFTKFQDCILALTSICQTKGLKWVDAENASKRKLLYSAPLDEVQPYSDIDPTVIFELDDGTKLIVPKNCIIDSSPAFSAMFDGHFLEASKQLVRLRDTSKTALLTLVTQIHQQFQPGNVIPVSNSLDLDLTTLFELLSLSDQFLLENLHERTVNTIISFYFCPHSALKIYNECLKYESSQKYYSECPASDIDLSKLALKYLLVGEDICFTLRSSTLWKLFDVTNPSVVIQDIKSILYPHVK